MRTSSRRQAAATSSQERSVPVADARGGSCPGGNQLPPAAQPCVRLHLSPLPVSGTLHFPVLRGPTPVSSLHSGPSEGNCALSSQFCLEPRGPRPSSAASVGSMPDLSGPLRMAGINSPPRRSEGEPHSGSVTPRHSLSCLKIPIMGSQAQRQRETDRGAQTNSEGGKESMVPEGTVPQTSTGLAQGGDGPSGCVRIAGRAVAKAPGWDFALWPPSATGVE